MESSSFNEKYNLDLAAKLFKEDFFIPSIVIGGGSAGYTAGLYLAQAGYQPSVIIGKQRGGALAKSNSVQNWPGTILEKGFVVTKNIEDQAVLAGAKMLEEEVISIDFSIWPFSIKTKNLLDASIKEYRTLGCVIATGATPNRLNIEGESKYWGRGVTNCAICDASLVKNKVAVVVGGGDSAITDAILLANHAKKVYIFVRKNSLRAKKDLIDQLNLFSNVEVCYETELKAILGTADGVSEIILQKNNIIEKILEKKMLVSGVFLAIGSTPNSTLFKGQLKIKENGCIETNYGQETSVPGVFAAGDVITQEFRQAIIASGDGCRAALQVIKFFMHLKIYPQLFIDSIISQAKLINQPRIILQSKKEEIVVNQPTNVIGVINIKSESDLQNLFSRDQRENKIVLLDFSAVWCGPCQRLFPIIQDLSNELNEDVLFCKIDIDELSDLAQTYKIRGVPTLIILDKNENELKKMVGVVEKEFLKSLLLDLKKDQN